MSIKDDPKQKYVSFHFAFMLPLDPVLKDEKEPFALHNLHWIGTNSEGVCLREGFTEKIT